MKEKMTKKKRKQTEEEMYMPDSEEEFQADLDAQDMKYLHYCREPVSYTHLTLPTKA